MPRDRTHLSHDAFKQVFETVEDLVFESHRFPGVTEIVRRSGISENRTREILETLVGQNQLCVVYQAPSHPTLYACQYMMLEIQRGSS